MNTDLNEKLKEYQRNYYASKKSEILICFYSIKISKQILKFNDYLVNKKEFHVSKQAIALNLVDANKVVITDKFKYSDDGSKYFIDYLHDDDVIRPLCIILPQIIHLGSS